MEIEKLIGFFLGIVLVAFVLYNLFLFFKDRQLINSYLLLDSNETQDLKIFAIIAKSKIVTFGQSYQYAKFQFANNEVYVSLRNNHPKRLYFGPLVIKASESNSYSYFSMYELSEFKIIGDEIKIGFKPKNLIGTTYFLHLVNVNEEDRIILSSNLC
ncbi:hypothetical protein [Flavobacterium macacae]|uniref:Uncharacterized protein n=1 Tax=Flavobacterium macacae TaxID=2488993 RepID=A0A3P3W8U8_9FLAO|nr:hypothetical protein [Flavobacterium macacae]RRJ90029.1 hypothetical protein EG849_11950 [Flavobacterium macacae]